jgi:exodeoxyribonuclease VII small subunit
MPPTESPPVRFEQALIELESILRELEDGTTSLEDSLARYERGVGLLRQCYAQLRDAEQKVKLLAGLNEDGSAELKPFEHVATIETAKAAARKPPKPGGSGISG